jgi:branched-chain amino acid transport system permease protein
MAICAALGVLIERFAYRPLRSSPSSPCSSPPSAFRLFLEYAGQFVFGAAPKKFPPILPVYPITHLGGLSLNSNQVVVLVVTLLLAARAAVHRVENQDGHGDARRVVQSRSRRAHGREHGRVISFTFALGSALAAAAGILWAINYPAIDPLMGILPGLKAFVAAVLGGIGNLPGAALGGIIIGVTETLVSGYISSTYRDAIAFAVLILILLVKPSGLLGKKEVEKV